MYLFILGLSKDEYIAEEVTEEAFFHALEGIGKFRGECDIRVWLCQIAKNEYYRYLRKNKRLEFIELSEKEERSDVQEKNVEQQLVDSETAVKIHRILHEMKEPYKEVFNLRVFGELSFEQIGEIFGKNPNWACVTYHRARMKIQKEMVDEHLECCEKCRIQAESMGRKIVLPKDTDVKLLEKVQRRLFRKKVTNVVVSVLCAVLFAVLVMIHLNSAIRIPYDEDSISVQENEEGEAIVTITDYATASMADGGRGDDGKKEAYISRHTTKWNQFFGRVEQQDVYNFTETWGWEEPVERIYYYPGSENEEAVCIYNRGEPVDGGMIVLPSLTLNYYMVISAVFVLITGIVCVSVKKREKTYRIMWKIMWIPASYLISSMLILGIHGKIYDGLYYFTRILVVAVIIYAIGYWVMSYRFLRSKK